MLRLNEYYISRTGRLIKIISQFNFRDGYNYIGAYFNVQGETWEPARFNAEGSSQLDVAVLSFDPTDTYKTFLNCLNYKVHFERTNPAQLWVGSVMFGGSTIINLSGGESSERMMTMLKSGAQQRLLQWMSDSGHDDSMNEAVS